MITSELSLTSGVPPGYIFLESVFSSNRISVVVEDIEDNTFADLFDRVVTICDYPVHFLEPYPGFLPPHHVRQE